MATNWVRRWSRIAVNPANQARIGTTCSACSAAAWAILRLPAAPRTEAWSYDDSTDESTTRLPFWMIQNPIPRPTTSIAIPLRHPSARLGDPRNSTSVHTSTPAADKDSSMTISPMPLKTAVSKPVLSLKCDGTPRYFCSVISPHSAHTGTA